MKYIFSIFLIWAICLVSTSTFAKSGDSILDLSLEELIKVEITTATKTSESAFNVPAAIYVITAEDIQNSGYLSIPELLRMVPGIHVQKINASKWSVSIRNSNNLYTKSLLVMLDGRSVYNPFFGGVYWEEIDYFLPDIERIEIIRGPGGTAWGSNAIDGVINIITKNAQNTTGGHFYGGAGTEHQGFFAARYGWEFKNWNNSFFRVYAKGDLYDKGYRSDINPNDDWSAIQGGFRFDTNIGSKETLSVHGDYRLTQSYHRLSALPDRETIQLINFNHKRVSHEANIVAKWTHELQKDSNLSVQTYYDFRSLDDRRILEDSKFHIADIDIVYQLPKFWRQEITLGTGYRFYNDNLKDTGTLITEPPSKTLHLLTWFVQDKINIVNDRLFLTLGSKFELNTYTNFEFQPSAGLSWQINNNNTLWASFTRAVSTPTRLERDGTQFIDADAVRLIFFTGPDNFSTEKVNTYELGYRAHPFDWISLELALFFNQRSDVRSVQLGLRAGNIILGNNIDQDDYGLEFSFFVQPKDWLKFKGYYAFLKLNPTVNDISDIDIGLKDNNLARIQRYAQHVGGLWTYIKWGQKLDLSFGARYYDKWDSNIAGFPQIGRYFVMDTKITYHALKGLDFSLAAQNLFDWHHQESIVNETTREDFSEIETSVYARFDWQF